MTKKNKKRLGLNGRPEVMANGCGAEDGAETYENPPRLALIKVAPPARGAADDFGFDEFIEDSEDEDFDSSEEEYENAIHAAADTVEKTLFRGGDDDSHPLVCLALDAVCRALREGKLELLEERLWALIREVEEGGTDSERWFNERYEPGGGEPDEFDGLIQEAAGQIVEHLEWDSEEFNKVFLCQTLRLACVAAGAGDHDAFARHLVNYMRDAESCGDLPILFQLRTGGGGR